MKNNENGTKCTQHRELKNTFRIVVKKFHGKLLCCIKYGGGFLRFS